MPGLATSLARIDTASCNVVLFTVLVRIEPFQKTCDGGLVMKPFPEMNNVNASLPAVMLAGKRPVITGVGVGCELDPQPASTIVSARSFATTVHRNRISSILL